jgi:acetolactate synthase-1/2/3 large subunit
VIDLPKDILIAEGAVRGGAAGRGAAPLLPPAGRARHGADPQGGGAAEGGEAAVVYAGGGVINAGPEASRLLGEFVRMTDFPCTNTLMGLGRLPRRATRTSSACSACTAPTRPTWHAWLRRHAEHRRALR